MSWIEVDKARNDLALSQYHDGKYAQCLDTLNETIAGKVKNEKELQLGAAGQSLPPCDFDNYIDVARSTWHNKTLCTSAMSARSRR